MKLVLFDCDGTLVDSQGVIVEAMERTFQAHDRPAPPRDAVLSIVGLTLDRAIAELVGTGIDETVVGLTATYRTTFQRLRRDPSFHEPLYPGAEAAVKSLARREDLLLGVATGKSRRGLDAVLASHGLAAHFATLQTADDAPSKPHPEMVLRAVRETGVEVGDVVVVGDTGFDMEMAVGAGARGLGVAWGYHPRQRLVAAGADRIVDDFGALVPALDAMFGPAGTPSKQRSENV